MSVDYGHVATVIDELPALVLRVRQERGLSYRQAASEIGIAHSGLYQIERGERYRSDVLLAVLRWLDTQSAISHHTRRDT